MVNSGSVGNAVGNAAPEDFHGIFPRFRVFHQWALLSVAHPAPAGAALTPGNGREEATAAVKGGQGAHRPRGAPVGGPRRDKKVFGYGAVFGPCTK